MKTRQGSLGHGWSGILAERDASHHAQVEISTSGGQERFAICSNPTHSSLCPENTGSKRVGTVSGSTGTSIGRPVRISHNIAWAVSCSERLAKVDCTPVKNRPVGSISKRARRVFSSSCRSQAAPNGRRGQPATSDGGCRSPGFPPARTGFRGLRGWREIAPSKLFCGPAEVSSFRSLRKSPAVVRTTAWEPFGLNWMLAGRRGAAVEPGPAEQRRWHSAEPDRSPSPALSSARTEWREPPWSRKGGRWC